MGKLILYILLSPFYIIGVILKPAKLLGSIWNGIWSMIFVNDVDKHLRHKRVIELIKPLLRRLYHESNLNKR